VHQVAGEIIEKIGVKKENGKHIYQDFQRHGVDREKKSFGGAVIEIHEFGICFNGLVHAVDEKSVERPHPHPHAGGVAMIHRPNFIEPSRLPEAFHKKRIQDNFVPHRSEKSASHIERELRSMEGNKFPADETAKEIDGGREE